MKLSKVTGNTPFALHGSNKNLILTVVEVSLDPPKPYAGVPAILTDGVMWYSAELVDEPGERLPVAYAVNGYEDKSTARRNAESR